MATPGPALRRMRNDRLERMKRLAIHVQRMRRSEELCASMQDPAVRKATEYGAVS